MLTQSAIQNFFHADYSGTNQLLAQILEPIFGEYDLGYDEITKNPTIKDKAKGAHIKIIKHVATFWAEGLDIKVFDVTLEDNCHIHIARKNIQLLVREYVEKFEGAFIVFHYENTANRSWRLSYLEKRQNTAASTNAKRYTYLCGKNYPCRTIAERFYALQSQDINAINLEKAFSVEALSDEFFEEYRNFYQDLVNFVKYEDNLIDKFISFANGDKELAEKYARDYIKKLMGRLVFIQFLQNKAWLNKDIHYTHTLFDSCTEKQKDDFLDNVLEPLFFGVFNTPKHQRESLFKSEHWDKKLYNQWEDFPYLNGGLFERDDLDRLNLPLPSYFFSNPERKDHFRKPTDEYYNDACGIFDFFDRYNFTIDESDPLDREVGVDPEMLGKIFENLLEDNKDKGAFYTPKEIVDYMCKESLVAYLVTEAQQGNNQAKDTIEKEVRILVEDPDMALEAIKQYGNEQLQILNEALCNVKICDPAIGSGAFPMGLLNLLFKCRKSINKALDIPQKDAELKKEIIQNNIYGVDIEKGAIDIARLRFWLSIVVDLDTPEALPNFDYKFMQGNSLLEQFQGVDLSNLLPPQSVQGGVIAWEEETVQQVLLNEKKEKYFSETSHENKSILRNQINQVVKNLVNIRTQGRTDIAMALKPLDVSANDQFFLWHTWFAEVFNRPSKQGFDIVIGNPPYVNVKHGIDTSVKNLYTKIYDSAKGQFDLFTLFIELAFSIGRSVAYIVPKPVLNNENYTITRKQLLNNNLALVVTGSSVFESAGVESCIFLTVEERLIKKVAILEYTNLLIDHKKDIDTNFFHQANNNIFSKEISDSDIEVMNKLNRFNKLDEILIIKRGIEAGKKDDSIVEYPTKYKLLRGQDLERYNICFDNKYCEFDVHDTSKFKDISLYNEGKIILRRVTNFIQATYDNAHYVVLNTIYCAKLKAGISGNLKFFTAILNSKVISFWFFKTFCNTDKLFPYIRVSQLEQIPIPNTSLEIQKEVASLVDDVIAKKTKGVESSDIERQIDNIIYQLYNLTDDEIKLIEQA